MALAIDASTPAVATITAGAVVTASFTPPSGSLVVLLIGTNTATAGTDASVTSVTNTGTAITWTRRARKNINASSTGGAGQAGGAEIWTGVGTGGAIAVTVNGLTGTSSHKYLQAVVFTGADTTSLANVAAAASSSGTPTVTVTSCLAGSYVIAVKSDWAQKGSGTAGTGQTIVSTYNPSGQITVDGWRTTAVLSGAGSQTMNLTAPTLEQYDLVALEVRDAGGGGSSLTANPADAEGITDSVTDVNDAVRSQADAEGITDAATPAADRPRSQADPVGLTDAAGETQDYVRTPGDPVGMTDSLTVAWDRASTIGDGLGVADPSTPAADRPRSQADAVGVTDNASASTTSGGTANIGDAQGITDSITATFGRVATVSDFLALSDSATPSQTFARSATPSDAVGLTDSVTVTRSGSNDGTPVLHPTLTGTAGTATLAGVAGDTSLVATASSATLTTSALDAHLTGSTTDPTLTEG